MTADTSWTQRARSWVAPPPAWIFDALDRAGERIATGPLLLLVYLWTLADAPSKREPGHAQVAHRDVLQAALARRFGVGLSTLKGWEKSLREAGLMARPSEGVVTLADVGELGYLDESTPGIKTGGVSTAAPAEVQDPGPPRSEILDHDSQDPGPPRSEILDPRGLKSWTPEVQDPGPPLRKPDQSRSIPDSDPTHPRGERVETELAKLSEYRHAERWCTRHSDVGQAAVGRWLTDLEARMRDGLSLDSVQRLVAEHVRQTREAKSAGKLEGLQAQYADKRTHEIGLPPLSALWSNWSKAIAWRAAALGQGVSVSPRSSFAGGLEGGLKYMDAARAAEDARRAKR